MMFTGAWLATRTFFAARKWILWAVLALALVLSVLWGYRWVDNWFEERDRLDQQRIQLAEQLAVANTTAQINLAAADSMEQQMLVERARYATLEQEIQAAQQRARAAESKLRQLRQQLTTDIQTDPAGAVARMNATLATIQAQLEGEQK